MPPTSPVAARSRAPSRTSPRTRATAGRSWERGGECDPMATASASRRSLGARGAPRQRRPPGAAGPGAIAGRVRWERLGRMALLLVLMALLYLYGSAGVHMLSTWRQARHDDAAVAVLEREHRALVREHGRFTGTGTLEADARKLGMMRPGEQPYVISGLPKN